MAELFAEKVQPIVGESLNGLLVRAAAANYIDTAGEVIRVITGNFDGRGALPSWTLEALEELSKHLMVGQNEILARAFLFEQGSSFYRCFSGIVMHPNDFLLRRRCFAPLALRSSPHHRMLWHLKSYPFCDETWEYLIDTCHLCGAVQRWVLTIGVQYCDNCSTNLTHGVASLVPVEQRSALTNALGIVHPDIERRALALGQLPASLAADGSAHAYELLVRLMSVVDNSLWGLRGGPIWRQPPEVLTSAMSRAWEMMLDWPTAFEDFAERLAINRHDPRRGDGNANNTRLFIRLPVTSPAATRLPPAMHELHKRYDIRGPGGAQIRARTMTLVEVIKALGLQSKVISSFRRGGVLKPRLALDTKRVLSLYDRAEIEAISEAQKDRSTFATAATRLGVSRHGVEQLLALGLLERLQHPFFDARYEGVQLSTRSIDRLQVALDRRAQADELENPVKLTQAAMAIGGYLKPWGPIIEALLDGRIPYVVTVGDTLLLRRVYIDRNNVDLLRKLRFAPESYPEVYFHDVLTKEDAGETLNLHPGVYHLFLKQFHRSDFGDLRSVPVPFIEDFAKRYISASEIGMRTGKHPRAVHARASTLGLKSISLAGYERQIAEQGMIKRPIPFVSPQCNRAQRKRLLNREIWVDAD